MRREIWRFAYLAEPLHGIMSVRSDKYGLLSRRAGWMQQPKWDDPDLDAGVMVRGGLWLLQEVGVGNVFTKGDIRAAFPDASQADRRIRDLRDYGWVLHTRADDASLQLEQTRLVSVGTEVWDPRARRASNPNKGISSKARDAIMARDDYMCTVCGITGGEAYPDDSMQTAVLTVKGHWFLPRGGRETCPVTVTSSARWWPWDLPSAGHHRPGAQVKGLTP